MIRGAFLLIAVAMVGVLHTLVPDHWLPIALVARDRGWSRRQTARAALVAGVGHVVTTLLIGCAVWFAGVEVAQRYGREVDLVSGAALVGFGLWIGIAGWREQRGIALRHRHLHTHESGLVHAHAHEHGVAEAHDADAVDDAAPPIHRHEHPVRGRTALLLILGSSPMVEAIPAFLAASTSGVALVTAMSIVLAASTIVTYVAVCVYSAERLQALDVGPLERYGEVWSGAVIALVGAAFLLFSR